MNHLVKDDSSSAKKICWIRWSVNLEGIYPEDYFQNPTLSGDNVIQPKKESEMIDSEEQTQ